MSSVPLLETLPIGTGPITTMVDQLFSLLEKISDEAFWNALFGDRALNLLKRYFGSDVVFLGFIVYLIRKVSQKLRKSSIINPLYSDCYISFELLLELDYHLYS